ncbi:amidohydrolase [Spartinivicinus poritis]|uniref:Amidohydrolase n=1 Tax=Spartinivicinus poritis TaxID=2994640 RepID=A0ABT5U9P2_9GAMM|nr:amidohydrolase [Spartinivicinus sp. A2-2]MDE1463091.1 amidohydrolase [Spartinivicinus sp. A2-2]
MKKHLVFYLFISIVLPYTTYVSPGFASNTTIYYGGDIITMNDSSPTAGALVVKDGIIESVGSQSLLFNQYHTKTTKLVNLNGKTLLPGFIDAHGHFTLVGFLAQSANLLPPPDSTVSNFKSMADKLLSHVNSPQAINTGWVIGMGYDNAQLEEQHHPTAADLDKIIADKPVVVIHQSGHLAAVNSKGLALIGYNALTPNPPGGIIRRVKGTNQPNGVLEESAFFNILVKLLSTGHQQNPFAMIQSSQAAYAAAGFTTAQEGRATNSEMKGLILAAQHKKLQIDVVSYPDPTFYQDDSSFQLMMSQRPISYFNHYRVGGIKLSLDGSPQAKTAWLTQPYHIPPYGQNNNYRGYPAMQTEDVQKYVNMAFSNNWQLLVHSNGDAASDQFITVVDNAIKTLGSSDYRSVMIHAQIIREDQLDVLSALKVIPSFMSVHTFYWGDWHRDSVLGSERAARISPAQSALKRNILYTSHNDAPVTLPNAMMILSSQVNRTTRSGTILGKEQQVSIMDALKSITTNAAYQYFEEDRKGSLEPGKLADLVILDKNPLEVDPEKINTIKVVETLKQGKTIYKATSM